MIMATRASCLDLKLAFLQHFGAAVNKLGSLTCVYVTRMPQAQTVLISHSGRVGEPRV